METRFHGDEFILCFDVVSKWKCTVAEFHSPSSCIMVCLNDYAKLWAHTNLQSKHTHNNKNNNISISTVTVRNQAEQYNVAGNRLQIEWFISFRLSRTYRSLLLQSLIVMSTMWLRQIVIIKVACLSVCACSQMYTVITIRQRWPHIHKPTNKHTLMHSYLCTS